MQRTCDVCAKPFEAQRPTAKYCGSSCRARRSRAGAPVPVVAVAPVSPGHEQPDVDERPPVDGLIGAVRVELEELKQVNTVVGQHALELAKRIVNSPGMNTGVSSLSKELSRVLGEARSASTVVDDPVDDLKARRDAKRAAAAG